MVVVVFVISNVFQKVVFEPNNRYCLCGRTVRQIGGCFTWTRRSNKSGRYESKTPKKSSLWKLCCSLRFRPSCREIDLQSSVSAVYRSEYTTYVCHTTSAMIITEQIKSIKNCWSMAITVLVNSNAEQWSCEYYCLFNTFLFWVRSVTKCHSNNTSDRLGIVGFGYVIKR